MESAQDCRAMRGRLLVVDGHAYAYRAFYAIRGMRSPEGEPTGAIFGFIRMLGKMRAALSPSHCVVVWDGGLSGERLAALPEYKAHRPELPAELGAQIEELVGYSEAAGVASVCVEEVEADDLIGCVARRAAGAGLEVVIASSDKDFMQLVSPGIGLLNPGDRSEAVWGVEQVRAKAGVEPGQVVDWLSLVGDSVDNIPGVPGVGPKTAAELLGRFGSVEGIYGRLAEVASERLRGALAASEAVVRRNLGLVRLNVDLAWDFSLEDFRLRPADGVRLAGLYRRWGFRSLLAEVESGAARSSGQGVVEQAVLI